MTVEQKATGGWTEAKVDKAVALFDRIIDLVGDALNVPYPELRKLWLKGQMPELAPPEPAVELTEPVVTEPKQAESLPKSASDTGEYRLKDRMGQFLRRDGEGFTRREADAWTGDTQRLETLQRRNPHLKRLNRVPA